MPDPSWTRRRFITAFGAATAGLALAGGVADATRTHPVRPTIRRYLSRPDLHPPNIDVVARQSGTAAGMLLFTPNGGATDDGLMIVNDHGHLVWFHPVAAATGLNLQVQQLHGEPVLTWWEGTVVNGHGQGVNVITDTSYREVQRVSAVDGYQADLHDFVLTDSGTALLLAYRPRPADLTAVGGPADGMVLDSVVQEVGLDDGGLRFQWSALDHVDVTESYGPLTTTPAQQYDFAHLNSLDVDADGNLLVSARNTWTVYKIDRGSGTVLWRLGGKRNDFTFGPDLSFSWQHDARRHADGSLTLFDDAADPQEEPQSRGLRLTVDDNARAADMVGQFTYPKRILTGSQGNVQVLPGGNVIVGWGTQPRLTEHRADNTLLLDVAFPSDITSYRSFRFPWVATPSDTPAAVISRDEDRSIVHASWNGATTVAAWRAVRNGVSGTRGELTTQPTMGFETTILVESPSSDITIQALDGAGHVLATTVPRVI